MLISVTVQLICAFVFAYAKRRFSHDAAHIYFQFEKTADHLFEAAYHGQKDVISGERHEI